MSVTMRILQRFDVRHEKEFLDLFEGDGAAGPHRVLREPGRMMTLPDARPGNRPDMTAAFADNDRRHRRLRAGLGVVPMLVLVYGCAIMLHGVLLSLLWDYRLKVQVFSQVEAQRPAAYVLARGALLMGAGLAAWVFWSATSSARRKAPDVPPSASRRWGFSAAFGAVVGFCLYWCVWHALGWWLPWSAMAFCAVAVGVLHAAGLWRAEALLAPEIEHHLRQEREEGRGIIGLPEGLVSLSAYREEWPGLFEREAERIRAAIGPVALDVQHVGSTAVGGLPAKPIIDIAVAVTSFEEAADCVRPLRSIGYEYRGENGIPRRHYLIRGRPRTHHLHVVEIDSDEWREFIAFRDRLRRDPRLAAEYDALKQDLARQFRSDRPAYQDGKAAFIRRVLDEPEGGAPQHPGSDDS